jgi:hypothetical protein
MFARFSSIAERDRRTAESTILVSVPSAKSQPATRGLRHRCVLLAFRQEYSGLMPFQVGGDRELVDLS